MLSSLINFPIEQKGPLNSRMYVWAEFIPTWPVNGCDLGWMETSERPHPPPIETSGLKMVHLKKITLLFVLTMCDLLRLKQKMKIKSTLKCCQIFRYDLNWYIDHLKYLWDLILVDLYLKLLLKQQFWCIPSHSN